MLRSAAPRIVRGFGQTHGGRPRAWIGTRAIATKRRISTERRAAFGVRRPQFPRVSNVVRFDLVDLRTIGAARRISQKWCIMIADTHSKTQP